jgi:murein L,D-transpeptidase YcbB/YkuD
MERGADDRRVNLPAPVPVYLFYTTIVVDEDERIFFFDDIYGHDATLAALLAMGYPYPA